MVETTFSFVSSKWFNYESSGYIKIKRLWEKKPISVFFRWAKHTYGLDDGKYFYGVFDQFCKIFLRKVIGPRDFKIQRKNLGFLNLILFHYYFAAPFIRSYSSLL